MQEKRKPGRPPKGEAIAEAVLAVADGPGKFTFKSKFRSDKVTLKKAVKTKNPDGSMTILSPQVYAEFSRNTWSTRNPELAGILRKRIEAGEDPSDPLCPTNIIETTSIEE
jgi:hypothetical protein